MRPLAGSEAFQPRSRKASVTEPLPAPSIRSASPVTFFLRRGSQGNGDGNTAEIPNNPIPSAPTVVAKAHPDEASQSPRRRSTLKAREATTSRGSPSAECQTQLPQQEPLTPLLVPSDTSSLPSSPKSTSTRSLRPSEVGSTAEETGSQAILSSGDEELEPEPSSQSAEGAPQLIMPSIKIPSRRPFTERGKRIGNFKILIAGGKGIGKTSLIKSIVQTCEDIVHVDPLPVSRSSAMLSSPKAKRVLKNFEQPRISEVSASTRPYPPWWAEIEESKILRRRRSTGDTVLDRNLCFVDTASREDCSTIYEYMTMQLHKALKAPIEANSDFVSLLSGSGGSQVDLVLYMFSKDTMDADISQMKALSELSDVVPLISKADQLSPDHIEALKLEFKSKVDVGTLSKLPAFSTSETRKGTLDVSGPYTVSSATGPDHETMDASLLMSPDYVQPLMPSELVWLVQHIFETEVVSYLRYSAAKKLIAWQNAQPPPTKPTNSPLTSRSFSPRPSSLGSPLPRSTTNPGMLVPFASDLALTTTSNIQAMTRLAEHAQQEERLAQVRLNKWANDLQNSLQRERERFEKLARGERAIWLVERMSEEVQGGRLSALDQSGALVKAGSCEERASRWASARHSTHDPLGLLRWSDSLRTRGWIALQVIGSFGMIGGLAFWLARTWGLTSTINEWTHAWTWNPFAVECNHARPIFI
ncbi:hypothetical protein EPUS_02110 [Endocarpon pusillum Z07020]|uniref:Septin-type G domain-containing protein n=1 Tax=Endocarpon pusillum (strain Z07020 / HMAS-L-300199) TaxID=1263415 RepID=U1GJA6_ENDPU|nr:uncharacterized protein EPUS_02110 [Endocarpon pusillum Z07020]ERF72223.1 hypothetical protein EPUS_02110 [Endocarpon pusillum Z07020]